MSESLVAPSMPRSLRLLRVLVTALAFVVFAATLAHWIWRWLLPPAHEVPGPVTTSAAPDLAAAARLFTTGAPPPGTTASVATSAVATDGTRLLGVFAERDGEGYALLRLPDRGAVLVRAGAEIAPGVVLRAVTPEGIRIDDRGAVRELALRASPNAAGAATPARPSPAAARRASNTGSSAACAARPGFQGPVYRLNAELLGGLAEKPEAWRDLFQPQGNGLAVREGHAFAAMLGLQPGDRVLTANGVALANAEDVRVSVLRPLLASRPVEIDGMRDGKPAAWLFVNAGSCPG